MNLAHYKPNAGNFPALFGLMLKRWRRMDYDDDGKIVGDATNQGTGS